MSGCLDQVVAGRQAWDSEFADVVCLAVANLCEPEGTGFVGALECRDLEVLFRRPFGVQNSSGDNRAFLQGDPKTRIFIVGAVVARPVSSSAPIQKRAPPRAC